MANVKLKILCVDDEPKNLKLLEAMLRPAGYEVILAENGKVAVETIQMIDVDLVVTDLKMPVMDGFELLAFVVTNYPKIPVIVMTAFGTPAIEDRILKLGAVQYIEQPVDFEELGEKITAALDAASKGHISGIALPSFLQFMEIEEKTCALNIRAQGMTGTLYFVKGEMQDAETGPLKGEEAAYKIIGWNDAKITFDVYKKRSKRIKSTLSHILLESSRMKDENKMVLAEATIEDVIGEVANKLVNPDNERRGDDNSTVKKEGDAEGLFFEVGNINLNKKEINIMAIQDKLKEFASIDGFDGVAIYTPAGESIAVLEAQGSTHNLKKTGVMANNILMNAKKVSTEMGLGMGDFVHVETEQAHIIVECFNEGTDHFKTQPGKAHVNLVLILKGDASIGLAKMKVTSILQHIASELRI
ncbi:MAG: response regulator [Nitrospinota bacterium]|nr:response regulator [Nitrospinota bacterium]